MTVYFIGYAGEAGFVPCDHQIFATMELALDRVSEFKKRYPELNFYIKPKNVVTKKSEIGALHMFYDYEEV